MRKQEVKHVPVWQLRCWRCAMLKKDVYADTYSCPRNVFKKDYVFPMYFAEKCSLFEEVKKEEEVKK